MGNKSEDDGRELPESDVSRELLEFIEGNAPLEKKEKFIKHLNRLEEAAFTDPLTGVFNRRGGSGMLEREISRSFRHGEDVSLIFLDIDFFKEYNDKNGHLKGDDLLRNLCEYLKNKLRGEDIISRYGGEEFEIILPGASLLDAYKITNKIRIHVKEEMGITFSAGISSSQNSGVILLYGKSGRELLNAYIESRGNLKAVEERVKEYSEISKISQTKVKIMLDNIYHFLVESGDIKTDYNLDSNYRKFGLELMRKFADDALYRAKEDGRNRVYAHTRPREIILNPEKKAYYGSSAL